mmetsp:Transcript_25442/g.55922  ORF Transcript_25442/g.55922 Transcript_25442/m.55922 type:complete len:97 (+) Transcript_25442:545-835(+)
MQSVAARHHLFHFPLLGYHHLRIVPTNKYYIAAQFCTHAISTETPSESTIAIVLYPAPGRGRYLLRNSIFHRAIMSATKMIFSKPPDLRMTQQTFV